jgi:glycosyltransferase involved in cell wall biosynthesis
MKISVIIPTYKRPALLLRCLDAVRSQVFNKEAYEIIVVSDGPDKATLEALQPFTKSSTPPVRYFQLPEKKGPAAARNAGWREASGELIAFTDDDCIPDINWLKNFWDAFNRRPYINVAFTGYTVVPIPETPTDYELNISHLATAEFITANCACTKNALIETGGFDEAFTMAWREDSDLQFKMLERGMPIFKVQGATVIHPVRKTKWGISLKDEKKGMFNALLYKKFPELYQIKIQPRRPWLYYGILLCFFAFIVGIFFEISVLTISGLSGWIILNSWFIIKRLKSTSRNLHHVIEMIVTSIAIPFLSLYWRWYGAFKYRTLLI